MSKRILLFGGSAEARQIALALRGQGLQMDVLMSEPPRGDVPMPVPWRLYVFDDVAALAAQMAQADLVVDASHGFDAAATQLGSAAAVLARVPFVTLSRPVWRLEAANWRAASDVTAAMGMTGAGARVFAATGWESLPQMAGFAGEVVLLRQTTRHDRSAPYDFVELVFGEAPFSVISEEALFKELRVDTLICRNLGGVPSRPKLEAAKTLGLRVILIDRPPLPQGVEVVETVKGALDWVAGR